MQNTSTTDGIYLSFDGGTAVHSLVDGLFIGSEETWCGQLPNTTVTNLTAISSDIAAVGSAAASAIVIALLKDV